MKLLRSLDRAVYRGERVAAASLFLLMSLVMFASVLHRVFSRPEGKLSGALLGLLEKLGVQADPATIHGPVSLGLNLFLAWMLCALALRTAERAQRFSVPQALLYGAGVAAALAGLVKLLLVVAPNGLVWAPVISLTCMLWVGFLGASMATYEKRHLALEMGEKLWRGRALTVARALAWFTAAAVSLFLLVLSFLSISEHYAGWTVNHLSGNLLPTSIPKWVVFLIFPYTFIVMSLRFFGQMKPDANEEKAA